MSSDIFQTLGFDRNPFSMAADTEGYFHTEVTKQILEELAFGILSRKGFLLLSGEVGVGKTSLLFQLLRRLEKENLVTSWIFNTMLNKEELLQAVARDFGLDAPKDANVAQLIDMLQGFLVTQNADDRNCAIIVDEAHNLSLPAMEALRMLSNLETSGQKLVQILLVGQPELKERLDEQKLRQLRSRITIYRELHAFDMGETERYVNFKLASAKSQFRLAKPALKRLYRATEGNTRMINLIMERSLYAAVAMGEKELTGRVMDAAIAEIATCQLEVSQRLGARRRMVRNVVLAAGILMLFGASLVPVFSVQGRGRSAMGLLVGSFLEDQARTPKALASLAPDTRSEMAVEVETPTPQQIPSVPETEDATVGNNGESSVASVARPQESSPAAASAPTVEPTYPPEYQAFLSVFGLQGRAGTLHEAVQKKDLSVFQAALPGGVELLKLDKLPGGTPVRFSAFAWGKAAGTGPAFVALWKPPFVVKDFYYGYRHENILKLQRWLKRLGYYWGPDDGMVGPVTWRAINSFQKDLKLKRTMWPDSETVFWLNAMSKEGQG